MAESYLTPYREAVDAFGAGFEATLWTDRAAQRRRFEVMSEMVDCTGHTLVDVGCGVGDFASFLLERGIEFQRFIGIDAVEGQLHKARRRNLPGCEFHLGDVVQDPGLIARFSPEIITISGALNTMTERLARRVIDHAFKTAGVGVVFNFLSDRPHPRYRRQKLGPARRFRTARWIDWALDRTPRVAFRQEYLDGHDATILMLHMD